MTWQIGLRVQQICYKSLSLEVHAPVTSPPCCPAMQAGYKVELSEELE